MRHGFTYEVFPALVREDQGHPPEYYANVALVRGLADSDAKNPVHSLASTVRKEAREGRLSPETGIVLRKVGRSLCCFVVSAASTSSEGELTKDGNEESPEAYLNVRCPPKLLATADLLVELRTVRNRGEALIWMADQWVESNTKRVDRFKDATDEIARIRASVTQKPVRS